MTRLFVVAAMVGVAFLAIASSAYASILPATLVNGAVTTYEDQSRESVIDVNGDGAFGVGDVIIGWLRIDDRVVPSGAAVPDDDLFAAFSIEVSATTSSPVGLTQTLYSTTFIPTTVVGLRLTDLIPGLAPLVPAGTSALAALYEDVGSNLITTPPGDFNGDASFDMLDYIDTIAAGNLDVVAGFDPLAPALPNPDFFAGQALVFNANDPNATLSLLDSTTLATPIGLEFDSGLSALFTSPGMPPLLRLVPAVDTNTGVGSLHNVAITNGGASGASDAAGASYFGNGFSRGGVSWAATDVYPLADNANVSFYAIPEPGSLLIWGLLLSLMAGLGVWQRKRK